MLWVLKEAYLKALGSGLAGGLSSLECRIEPPAVVARTADGAAVPQLALLAGQRLLCRYRGARRFVARRADRATLRRRR